MMRRICCFCESWESGGIESFLNNVLLRMDFAEMEVDIVAACIKESVFTAGLKEHGIRFVELSGKLRSPQNHQMFRELLRDRKYDVVHFNLFQGLSLYYVQIAKEEGVAVRIAHSHNSALRKSKGRVLKLLIHKIGSGLFTEAATDFWACSRVAAEFLFSAKTLKEKQFCFIPNGIETERFRFDQRTRETVRAQLGLTDTFVIGNVGRLCYQKNQDFLLDVFAEVLKRKPESRLLLVGEGEQRSDLQAKVNRLGITEKVIFYGVTEHVEQLFWAMDAFAFPSLFEGLGIVAIEAQAAGLPVVCSEYIPTEAFVTPLIQMKPLSAGAKEWEKAICSIGARTQREMVADEIRKNGFDVRYVAKEIETCYRGT